MSPLPSYATVTTQHVASLSESVRLIWNWLRGIGPDWRQRHGEAKLIAEIADLMAEEEAVGSWEAKDGR